LAFPRKSGHWVKELILIWKRKLRDAEGRLEALRLESTCSLRGRQMQTDHRSSAFIRHMREKHPQMVQMIVRKRAVFRIDQCERLRVERFNRTLKKEFVDNNLDVIDDTKTLRERLAEYLAFYNTERPHKALGLQSPVDFLFSEKAMSKMCGTHTLN
jgi:hypothetical protein